METKDRQRGPPQAGAGGRRVFRKGVHMTDKPLMAKATAVWLVDNTTISFKQIGDFCGLHELEVQGIADGDVATGVKGFDPVGNNQLEQSEIDKAEKNPLYKMKMKYNAAAVDEDKRRGPRYTPLSKRQDRPASILWLVKFHPELSDGQIDETLLLHDVKFPLSCFQLFLDRIICLWRLKKSYVWRLWLIVDFLYLRPYSFLGDDTNRRIVKV